MTKLLCPCGETFEAEFDNGELQILCSRCASLVADPTRRIEAPCWRRSSPAIVRPAAASRPVRRYENLKEAKWGA